MTTPVSRRGFLAGLIAAPAILKLGIHMPIKSALGIIEPALFVSEIVTAPQFPLMTLLVPQQFATINLAVQEAYRILADTEAYVAIQLGAGLHELSPIEDRVAYVANSGPNRKARRRMAA